LTTRSNSKGQEYSIQLYDPANALTIPKSYILKNYTKTENAMFVMRQPTETGLTFIYQNYHEASKN